MGRLIDMREAANITIPSDPKYLSAVRAITAKIGQIHGMDDAAVEGVKLAVDEACCNVIRHAYKGDTGRKIVVKFRVGKKGFEVVIEDDGVKADPERIKGRDLDDVRPGGLGVHFIKRAFDVYTFDEKKKKGNRQRLIRYWRKEDGNRGQGL